MVRTSTLVGLQLPVSALLQPPDVDLLLQATADPRGTLIHTDRDPCHGPAPQDATEPVHDRFLRARDHHPDDEEDGETALVATAAGEEEAQVIAVTVAMIIGAEAEAVDGEVVAGVSGITIDFTALEFGMARKSVTLFSKIPMKPCSRARGSRSY